MDELTNADIAYIAGLFEGEACFSLQRHTPSPKSTNRSTLYRARIVISMTDADVINWLSKKLHEKAYSKKQSNPNWSPQTAVELTRRTAMELLPLIIPHMKSNMRRRQAELCLRIMNSVEDSLGHRKPNGDNAPLRLSEIKYRNWLWEEMERLRA